MNGSAILLLDTYTKKFLVLTSKNQKDSKLFFYYNSSYAILGNSILKRLRNRFSQIEKKRGKFDKTRKS